MLLSQLSLGDYQLLVEQAPIMIWRTDSEAKCDYFNARWLAFTGAASKRMCIGTPRRGSRT